MSDILVRLPTKDFSAASKETHGAHPDWSSLTCTGAVSGFIEWKASLPRAGKWRLHFLMTAQDRRPCSLTINGVKQSGNILEETTGSWHAPTLAWTAYGPYDFKEGENLVRIDFGSFQPHLKELGFSEAADKPVGLAPIAASLPWRRIPDSGAVIGLCLMRDGTFLGVGTDNQLYTRASLEAPWKLVPTSGAVKSVVQLRDGTIAGVGMDNMIWTRATLTSNWVQVPGSGAISFLTQLRDWTLAGVGMDDAVYTRPTLRSPWTHVPNSANIRGLMERPDGTLVAMGMEYLLHDRPGLKGSWTQIPGGGAMLGLVELPDGSLVGVGRDNFLYLADRAKKEAAVAAQLAAQEKRLAALEAAAQRAASLEEKVAAQEKRLAGLSSSVDRMAPLDRVSPLESGLAGQEKRLAPLEEQLAAQEKKLAELFTLIGEARDILVPRLAALEDRLAEQDRRLAEQDRRLAALEAAPAPAERPVFRDAPEASESEPADDAAEERASGGDEDPRRLARQGDRIIRSHAAFVAAAALVPFAGVDLVAVSRLQLEMVEKLTDLYGHRDQWSDGRGRRLIRSVLSEKGGAVMAGSLMKLFPPLGVLSLAIEPASASAATSALGRAFLEHYAAGGDLDSFDPLEARRRFRGLRRPSRRVSEA
jgi:uncharacterized protein (DUF697 family)/uncharacterized coiled-coil protein SlyX